MNILLFSALVALKGKLVKYDTHGEAVCRQTGKTISLEDCRRCNCYLGTVQSIVCCFGKRIERPEHHDDYHSETIRPQGR